MRGLHGAAASGEVRAVHGTAGMMRAMISLVLVLLAACTLALPGGKADAPAPLANEVIEVTTLDAPKGPTAPAGKTTPTIATKTPDAVTPAKPDTATDATARPVNPATAATEPAATAAPPAPLSPAALACKKKGGRYIKTGSSDLRACVKETGEEGKSCKRETDCIGSCLARSGTCAPVKPLFGCNEILQADGRRVTLCLD